MEGEKLLLEGLEVGRVRFVLKGGKLSGEFSLVKMKGGQEGAWLLIKKMDEAAVQEGYNSEEHLEGVTQLAPQKPANKIEEVGPKVGGSRANSSVER